MTFNNKINISVICISLTTALVLGNYELIMSLFKERELAPPNEMAEKLIKSIDNGSWVVLDNWTIKRGDISVDISGEGISVHTIKNDGSICRFDYFSPDDRVHIRRAVYKVIDKAKNKCDADKKILFNELLK